MKATGIVRRMDDLGRVVIPKEIRRNLKIKEGDALEIFTDKGGMVCFRRYSPFNSISLDSVECVCHSTFGKDYTLYDHEGLGILPADEYEVLDTDLELPNNVTTVCSGGEVVGYLRADHEDRESVAKIIGNMLKL